MQQGQAPAPQRNQEILYNVEHYFHEGGKLVTRMPIVVGKETMWAEVAQTDGNLLTWFLYVSVYLQGYI